MPAKLNRMKLIKYVVPEFISGKTGISKAAETSKGKFINMTGEGVMKILRGAPKIFRHPKGGALKKLGVAP